DTIILGAWGCGVFKNDPRDVAAQFQAALTGDFAGVFRLVSFAVLDHKSGAVIAPFAEAFAGNPQ
ncbi:MAG TPA: TIGR02452 family protein, partial [Hyphomicrobiaceae bacterium]|nr:TIGR02452 family protein [Hyphomicrobiaceae bacterium]